MKTLTIFTYGTLMHSPCIRPTMPDPDNSETATIRGFEMYDLGPFPMVNKSEDPEREVHGVVHQWVDLDEDEYTGILSSLDRYESEGTLYHRTTTEVEFTYDGELLTGYVYIGDPAGVTDSLLPKKNGMWRL
jgi:gamma-glutamylcyclotransferase (GGCT)/AIG2-like uncharacterized protein YtfP